MKRFQLAIMIPGIIAALIVCLKLTGATNDVS